MQQIILQPQTPDEKRKREFIEGLNHSAQVVQAHLRGEIKLESARELLSEL